MYGLSVGGRRLVSHERSRSVGGEYNTIQYNTLGTAGAVDPRLYRAVESIGLEERAGRGGGLSAGAAGP